MNVIVEVMLAAVLGIVLFGTTIGTAIAIIVALMKIAKLYAAFKQAKAMKKEMMDMLGGLTNDKGIKKRRTNGKKRK